MRFLKNIAVVLLLSVSLNAAPTVSSQIGSLSGMSTTVGAVTVLHGATQVGGISSSGTTKVYASLLVLGGNILFDSNATVAVAENQNGVISVATTNSTGNPVNYTVSGGADAANFEINATTGVLSFIGNPNFEAQSSYTVVITATDSITGETALQIITITLNNLNDAPTFTNAGATAGTENTLYTYMPTVLDEDGDTTSITATNLPSWLSFGQAAGSSGTISAVAGLAEQASFNGDNQPAISATLNKPRGIAIDSSGNIYIADTQNYRIRKISTDGNITTIAGTGSHGSTGANGSMATSAKTTPFSVAVDSVGNVYFTEIFFGKVRKIDKDGKIYTIAGTGAYENSGDNADATLAGIKSPSGLAIDANNNIYVATASFVVRKIDTNNIITTIAGTGQQGYSGDGFPALNAKIGYVWGLDVDRNGNVYLADNKNFVVRKIATDGIITTVAGNGTRGYDGDGGDALSASIDLVQDVAIDSAGNLYLSMSDRYAVRRVSPDGTISTVAGNGIRGSDGNDGNATDARVMYLTGLALDSSQNLYMADYLASNVRKVTFDTTMALSGTPTMPGVYDVNLLVSDGELNTTQNYQITVSNVNDAPILLNHAFVVSQDAPVGSGVGMVQAYDEDAIPPSGGEVLTYAIVSGNTNNDFAINAATGEITTANTLELARTPNYNLGVSVTDDELATTSNSVLISVFEGNNIPVAVADSITIDEDTNATIDLVANDTDLDNNLNKASIVITKAPTHGSVDVNASGVATYKPNANYYGSDYFTYKVYDFTFLKSNEVNATITINNVNDAPTAFSSVVFTNEDTDTIIPLYFYVNDFDGIGDITSYMFNSTTSNGPLSIVGNSVFYNPRVDFYGFDTFTFHVVDAAGVSSNVATININVAEINDVPIARLDDATTAEDTPVNINVLANDEDPDGTLDATSVAIIVEPEHGTAVVQSDGTITYTPHANWFGYDTFYYTVLDDGLASSGGGAGKLISNEGAVVVNVTSVNDAPIAVDDTVVVLEDSMGVFSLHHNDIDVDNILSPDNITILTQPTNGVLSTIDNGLYLYIPSKDYNGIDNFTYKISDGDINSSAATVSLIVTAVNDAPSITSNGAGVTASIPIAENTTAVTTVTTVDVENDTIIFSIVGGADSAQFDINSSTGVLSFKIAPNFEIPTDSDANNTYVVEVNATDNGTPNEANTQTISVTVTDVNEAPTLQAISNLVKLEDASDFNIALEGNDEDNDPITYTASSSDTSIATTQISNNILQITSVADAYGVVTVEVNATANGLTDTKTFELNVTAVDDAPYFISTIANQTINEDAGAFSLVLAGSATDIEGDSFSYSATSSDTDLITVSVSSNSGITFTPKPNKFGTATVDVNVTQDSNTSLYNHYSFSVTINPINDAPIVTTTFADFSLGEDNGTSSYDLNISDIDGDDVNITVDSNNTDILRVTTSWINATEWISQANYTDFLDFNLSTVENANGMARVTITVDDAELSTTRHFDVNVTAVNDAPIITSNGGGDTASISIAENTTAVITVTANDMENDAITYLIVGGADSTKFDINSSSGVLTFKVAPDFENPTDSNSDNIHVVEINATDNGTPSMSDMQTISITVTNASEAPAPTPEPVTPTPEPVTPTPEPVTPTPEPVTPTPEPVVPAPTPEPQVITIILPAENGDDVNEIKIPSIEPAEVNTGINLSNYTEFEIVESTEGVKTKIAQYELQNELGETVVSSAKTEVQNSLITSIDKGLEIKAIILGQNGEEVMSLSTIHNNGLIDIIVTDSVGDKKSRISSYQVGGDIEINADGETAVTFHNKNDDNAQLELRAIAKPDGTVEHRVKITYPDGSVTEAKAYSYVNNSKVIVTDDNKIQTIAVVKNGNTDVNMLVQTDDKGNRMQLIYFTDEITGESIVSAIKTALANAVSYMYDDRVETSVEQGQQRSISITKLNGESVTGFEIFNTLTGQVELTDYTIDESTPFEAGNKILIENDSNGNMVIRTQTKITREIIFK